MPDTVPFSHCHACGAAYAHPTWPRRCYACDTEHYRNPLPVSIALVPVKGFAEYLGYFAGPDFSINPDQTGAVQIWYQRFEIEVQNRLVR